MRTLAFCCAAAHARWPTPLGDPNRGRQPASRRCERAGDRARQHHGHRAEPHAGGAGGADRDADRHRRSRSTRWRRPTSRKHERLHPRPVGRRLEQPTQPGYSLRGISSSDFGIGTDSPVGIYEDGVYTGKTGGALLTFNDVERIEVLKGPQGTLFGRNSAAGAISIVTNDPSDACEDDARVRLGNYGTRYGDGVLNLPLSQDLAFRLSVVDNQSDGWLQDAATGQHYDKNDDWGTRAALRWNAPGDTTVRLSWEHEELEPARPSGHRHRAAAGIPGTPPYPADPSYDPSNSSIRCMPRPTTT